MIDNTVVALDTVSKLAIRETVNYFQQIILDALLICRWLEIQCVTLVTISKLAIRDSSLSVIYYQRIILVHYQCVDDWNTVVALVTISKLAIHDYANVSMIGNSVCRFSYYQQISCTWFRCLNTQFVALGTVSKLAIRDCSKESENHHQISKTSNIICW